MTLAHLHLWIRFRLSVGRRLYPEPSSLQVRRLGLGRLFKHKCHPTEAEAMRYIRQYTSIPIPKLFRTYDHGDGTQDLVMEYIHGDALHDLWSSLTQTEKENIAKELAGYVSQLRQLQPPVKGFVGSLALGSGYDHRLGTRRFGPFQNVEDFHKYIQHGTPLEEWANHSSVTNVHNKSSFYAIKFTHADLSPENIMIQNGKVSAIIDWEFSGWFPEYWEYTKIYFGYRPYRKDFYSIMDKVLTTYPDELAAEVPLLRRFDLFSYDTRWVER